MEDLRFKGEAKMQKQLKRKNNRAAILNAAEALFEEKGFNQTSVLQIMKKVNLSTPLFYHYFSDKEDVFLHIADHMSLDMYREIVKCIKEPISLDEVLFNFYYGLFRFISTDSARFRVFREVEFIDNEVQKIFYTRLMSLLKKAIGHGVDDVALYTVFGAGYFVGLKFVIWDKRKDFEYLAKTVSEFIANGISTDPHFRLVLPDKVEHPREAVEEFATKGERTQARITRAAKQLFGRNGYWQTQISDISRASKIAVGTFYLYFNSKQELLRHIVVDINKELRKNAKLYTSNCKNRVEVEVNSLKAFADFIMKEKEAYRIVREAEFVDEEIGKWYYERIGTPYAKNLSIAMKNGEIRQFDPEILAYSLMGIGHFLGVQWIFWKKSNNIPEEVLLKAALIITKGIKNYKGGDL